MSYYLLHHALLLLTITVIMLPMPMNMLSPVSSDTCRITVFNMLLNFPNMFVFLIIVL